MCMNEIWSKEYVKKVMLIGDMDKKVCFEMMEYEWRMMKEDKKKGKEVMISDLNDESERMMDDKD